MIIRYGVKLENEKLPKVFIRKETSVPMRGDEVVLHDEANDRIIYCVVHRREWVLNSPLESDDSDDTVNIYLTVRKYGE